MGGVEHPALTGTRRLLADWMEHRSALTCTFSVRTPAAGAPGKDDLMAGDKTRLTPPLILGLSLIALGVLFGLDNLGLIEFGNVFRFWPVVLIAIGLSKLQTPHQSRGGIVWIGAGVGLLLHTLNLVPIWRLWPFLLVLIGAHIAYNALRPQPGGGAGRKRDEDVGPVTVGDLPAGFSGEGAESEKGSSAVASPTVTAFAFLGGVERVVRSQDFRAASVVAFMGGCEIDLRDAQIVGGEAVVDVTVIWGGVEIKVPGDWNVEWRGVALLGGFGDKTRGRADATARLIVTGQALMGGIEIHN
jgi:predicted membrane protein